MQPRKEKRPGLGRTKTKGAKHYTKRTENNNSQEQCKCPRCNYTAPPPLFRPGWLDDLQLRAARHWSMGYGPDLAAMTLIELHALWRYLLKQG